MGLSAFLPPWSCGSLCGLRGRRLDGQLPRTQESLGSRQRFASSLITVAVYSQLAGCATSTRRTDAPADGGGAAVRPSHAPEQAPSGWPSSTVRMARWLVRRDAPRSSTGSGVAPHAPENASARRPPVAHARPPRARACRVAALPSFSCVAAGWMTGRPGVVAACPYGRACARASTPTPSGDTILGDARHADQSDRPTCRLDAR